MGTEAQERGFYGWWLLFFLWIVYTIPVGFAFYGLPVLYPFMIAEMGWSRGEIMVGFSAIMLLMGIAAPLTAWMIGRFSARLTLFIGGIIVAVATFLMGFVGHIYPLYVALSIFTGLGVAFGSMIPVQTVIVFWFNARRALALGLVLGGGAIGGFLAPQIISIAVQNMGGNWRIGWFIVAIASIVGAVVAVFTVRNRPSDIGQHPDGIAPKDAKTAAKGVDQTTRTYHTPVEWTVRNAVKTPALWFLIIATTGCFFLWQVVNAQGPFHLQDRGFDTSTAAFFYSLAIGLSIAGRFAIAALGDIIEPRFLYAFSTLCVLLGGILFWFVSPDAMWAAYLYPLLCGFGFGAAYICIPTIIGNYWGTESFASINGLVLPAMMITQAMTAPLAGYLYDLQGTYLTVMIIAWLVATIGFVAMFLCTPPKPKLSQDNTHPVH